MTVKSFEQEVYEKLSAINVQDRVKMKGKLTYLSWQHAWTELMIHYPESSYSRPAIESMPDGSCEVSVTITIKQGDKLFSRDMWLPVCDHKNSAIKNPDSMAINKAKMRCLTKAIAMAGLGAYIYRGEDIPEAEAEENEKINAIEFDTVDGAIKTLNNASSMQYLMASFKIAWTEFKDDPRIQEIVEAKDEAKDRLQKEA